jgi:hypothetical protein
MQLLLWRNSTNAAAELSTAIQRKAHMQTAVLRTLGYLTRVNDVSEILHLRADERQAQM